jgi:hypothetical protein
MDQRRTHAVGDVCTGLVQEHLARAGVHDERTGGWLCIKRIRRDGGELQTA